MIATKGGSAVISADVTFEVNRPVEEVFTFLSDFENNLKWRASQVEGEDLQWPDWRWDDVPARQQRARQAGRTRSHSR
jgi:hypothetical protein